MILYFLDLYNTSKIWLIEREWNLFRVYRDKPEGDIKNKWWVETQEWDKD